MVEGVGGHVKSGTVGRASKALTSFDHAPQLSKANLPIRTTPSTSQLHQTFRPHGAGIVNCRESSRLQLPDSQCQRAHYHTSKPAMIASTTTVMLRSGVTRGGCALQPILLRSTTSCPYSTITAASPFASVRSKLSDSPASTTTSPATAARPSSTLTVRRQPAQRRHASTSTDHDADAAAASRAAQRAEAYARSNPDMPPLDWNSFFQLRKTRRRWQVGFSALMSLGCGAAGAVVLGSGAADALTGQIPLDPILTLGLITLGCTAMGWVVGPSLGNAVFYLIKRKYKAPMTVVSRPRILMLPFAIPSGPDWRTGDVIWLTAVRFTEGEPVLRPDQEEPR